jgi:tripartite-type tricarboxylate transporter receptor subunit TctC
MTSIKNRVLSAGIAVGMSLSATCAMADGVADFYKDKTLSIVVGHEVGTGFDTYARVLARHMRRHIPGHPNIVVQNMVGASGITAANWLYNVAPKDGTAVATFVQTAAFEPLLGNKAARFEAAKFAWIGNMEESVSTCGVSKASGITRFEDLLERETVFGSTGVTGPLATFALAIKNLLGAKVKLVSGYKGSASVKLALRRGEVEGVCMVMSTIHSLWREEYEAGLYNPVIQLSGRKDPELKNAVQVNDYAKTEEDRQVFGLIFGAKALGRIFAAPPGVPQERTRALQSAFMATMKDPQFLAEAAKAHIDISPMTGEEVETMIAQLSAVSPKVIERTKAAVRPN